MHSQLRARLEVRRHRWHNHITSAANKHYLTLLQHTHTVHCAGTCCNGAWHAASKVKKGNTWTCGQCPGGGSVMKPDEDVDEVCVLCVYCVCNACVSRVCIVCVMSIGPRPVPRRRLCDEARGGRG